MKPPPLLRRARVAMRRHRPLQVVAVIGFWGIGESFSAVLVPRIPGGVVGLALLLALLGSGVIHVRSLARGANWLIAEMLLFFVPAVMAVSLHRDLISVQGLKVLAVIVVGTTLVMLGTALLVDMCEQLALRRACR